MIHITVGRVAVENVRSIKEWLDDVGKDHLHHRLEHALGFHQASVAMICLMMICLGLAAVALHHAGTAEAVLPLVQACLIVAMITILEWSGRQKH